MGKNIIFTKIKEVFLKIINRILLLLGMTITVEQTMTGFLYNAINKISIFNKKENITIFMYGVLIIGGIYIVVQGVIEEFRRKVVIKIKAEDNPKIEIKLGNYENNMEGLLKISIYYS